MEKIFNYYNDIKGKEFKVPVDPKYFVLFETNENKYYVYSLYTNKKFDDPKLNEVSKDIFLDIKNTNAEDNPIYMKVTDSNLVKNIAAYSNIKAITDNLSIENFIDLSAELKK